jgi:hypothetical protein
MDDLRDKTMEGLVDNNKSKIHNDKIIMENISDNNKIIMDDIIQRNKFTMETEVIVHSNKIIMEDIIDTSYF